MKNKNFNGWQCFRPISHFLKKRSLSCSYRKNWDRGLLQDGEILLETHSRIPGSILYVSLVTHNRIAFIYSIMLSFVDQRNQDPRTIGELFYFIYDEIQDITLMETMILLLYFSNQRKTGSCAFRRKSQITTLPFYK
ncbi:MAG: hypothetical protein GYA51_05475 [Candidatus Methanofastidiosa archaeon]|nr:hypothetical protein [Candidatus Methanofastidiosa archaeon]